MPARYETLAGWANEYGWKDGVELGVFDGRTHFYLIENCPALNLVGIDLWGASAPIEGKTKSGEKCHCVHCNQTRSSRRQTRIDEMERRVKARSAVEPRSTIITGHTAKCAADFEAVDFVFVDGDHSTEGVSADIAAWIAKIRAGGRMVGHDWNMRSVRDAVHQHFDPAKIKAADDHIWWVQC